MGNSDLYEKIDGQSKTVHRVGGQKNLYSPLCNPAAPIDRRTVTTTPPSIIGSHPSSLAPCLLATCIGRLIHPCPHGGLMIRIAAVCLVLLSASARAGEQTKPFEGFTKYVRYHISYDVNPDSTHVETHDWALKILSDEGVSAANHASVQFSDRLQDAEILSAYTLKKGGRRIDVPPSNFQEESNTGSADASPMFSDLKTKTVAFPEVAVGDTVAMSYRLTQKEALFPGHFSSMHAFSKFASYDDVQIALNAPASLNIMVQSRGVDGGEVGTKNGRRSWKWSYRNTKIAKPESGAVSTLDYGPLVIASTFTDYGALAAAYDARARPKAEVTDRIKALAGELTRHSKTPHDQAKALYEWVSANVKMAGNCVGIGSVVPHEADLVLANRMGDCKDHSVLLAALLAAKGISSTPALINAGSTYTLPDVPSQGVFNHVITYIPSLDLYADSTSQFTPFGLLPPHDAGKPVIHTTDYVGIRRTPPTDYRQNRSTVKTLIRVHPDGSADGETSIELAGVFAETMRAMMTYLSPDMDETMVRRMLAAAGFTGTGTLSRPKAKDLAETFTYGSRYKIDDAMNLPGPGAMVIRSPFPSPGAITSLIDFVNEPEPTVDFVCLGGSSIEEYEIDLPAGVEVPTLPTNVDMSGNSGSYRARYEKSGNAVKVFREYEDRTAGNVCKPERATDLKPFAMSVMKDMRAQLVYQ